MTDSFFTSIYILAQDGRKDISSRDPAGESKFLARTLNIKYGGVLESLPLYDNKSKAVAAFFFLFGFCVGDEVIFNWPASPRYSSPVFLPSTTGRNRREQRCWEPKWKADGRVSGKTGALWALT